MKLPALLSIPALALTGCLIGNTEIGRSSEIDRGAEAAAEVEEQMGYVEDEPLASYVASIGARLVEASPRSDLPHEFHVLDMAEPNAFALPGGFIFVSRGLLMLVETEDELAAVIGHELGHVAARHHAKQAISDVPLAPIRIATGVGGALASIVSPTVGQVIAGTGQLTSALVRAPYSRSQEREADRLGQQFAAASGWDPTALSAFMTTLGREEKLMGGDPSRASFLATHPASAERSEAAAENAKMLTRVERPPIARDRNAFLAYLEGLLVGGHAAEGVFDGDEFLHPDLGIVLDFPSGWKQMNTDQFVAATDEERSQGFVMQLAAEGNDPMVVAREAAPRGGYARGPDAANINGLRAARATVSSRDTSAEVTWVAHKDLVFQLTGIAPTKDFDRVQPRLRKAADSFRPLVAGDRSRILEDRIHIVSAHEGDTIAGVLARHESRWGADQAAVANAILETDRLAAGRHLKITRPVAPAN